MLKTKPKFFPTDSIVPIKDIIGDIVITKNSTYLKIIKSPTINLKLRSLEEQDQLLEIWRDLLYSLEYPYQFYTQIRNLYLEDFMSNLENIYRKEKEPVLRESIGGHISHIKETVKEKNILERSFYIVVGYSPWGILKPLERIKKDIMGKNGGEQSFDLEYVKDELQSRAGAALDHLSRIGLDAQVLGYEELVSLYYFIFNSPLTPLRDRIADIIDKENFMDLIKPTHVFEGNNYLKVGGSYYRTLFARSYRRRVPKSFLQRLIDINQDIDISLHMEPVPTDEAQSILVKNIAKMESTRDRQLSKGIKDSVLKKTLEDAEELSDRIAVEEDRILDLSLYVNVIAENLSDLEKKTTRLRSTMRSMGISPLTAKLNMLDAFFSVAPLRENRLRKYRNMDTACLRGFMPFVSADISQGKGIYLGINKHNSSIVIVDFFSGKNYAVLVLGPSGTGKSYLVKNTVERYFFHGVDSVISDPQGEYTTLVKALGGETVLIGPGSDTAINIFDLVIAPDEKKFEAISKKASEVVAFLSLFLEGIAQRQRDIIENCVYKIYSEKQSPLLQDLYSALKKEELMKDFLPSLEKFCFGIYKDLFSRPTNIKLGSRIMNFDLYNMEEPLKPAITFLIKTLVLSQAKKELKKRIVVFDEVHRLLKSREASAQLEDFSRTVRKYWISPIFIDHEVGKLLSSEYGSVIVGNCNWKFIFQQEPTHVDKVADVFKLSREEKIRVQNLARGETLFFSGMEHILFKVDSSEWEHRLITTDPEELKKFLEEKNSKKLNTM